MMNRRTDCGLANAIPILYAAEKAPKILNPGIIPEYAVAPWAMLGVLWTVWAYWLDFAEVLGTGLGLTTILCFAAMWPWRWPKPISWKWVLGFRELLRVRLAVLGGLMLVAASGLLIYTSPVIDIDKPGRVKRGDRYVSGTTVLWGQRIKGGCIVMRDKNDSPASCIQLSFFRERLEVDPLSIPITIEPLRACDAFVNRLYFDERSKEVHCLKGQELPLSVQVQNRKATTTVLVPWCGRTIRFRFQGEEDVPVRKTPACEYKGVDQSEQIVDVPLFRDSATKIDGPDSGDRKVILNKINGAPSWAAEIPN
jgi:hypothetical protein